MNRLREALQAYDGKTIATLVAIRETLGDRASLLATLIELVGDRPDPVAEGATWLIKDRLEHGGRLTAPQTAELIDQLATISAWQARLDVCQSFRFLELPPDLTGTCVEWLKPLGTSDRPLLRAWSMDALQHLARHDERLAAEAADRLAAGERDPAASVRARARHWRRRQEKRHRGDRPESLPT